MIGLQVVVSFTRFLKILLILHSMKTHLTMLELQGIYESPTITYC
jgi:hypothetical protein